MNRSELAQVEIDELLVAGVPKSFEVQSSGACLGLV